MTKYTLFEAFAGIGGIGLGLESTQRFQVVGACEIDQKARAVLEARSGLHAGAIQADMKDVVMPVGLDLLAGGFPCQDISVGGSGAGLSGARSGAWRYMMEAVARYRPRAVLIENSDQLPKRGLDVILANLAAERYDAEWYTIAASAVGAPHRRLRTYVIAYCHTTGVSRLEPSLRLSRAGQWDWAGETHLRQIYGRPFSRSDLWPQPLVCRMDDGAAGRVHRLKLIGNSVVVPVVVLLGQYIAFLLDQTQ